MMQGMKDPHTIAGLIRKKTELLSQIERHLESVERLRADVRTLDEAARILDPEASLDEAKAKRQHVRLFAHGKLIEGVLKCFKEASGPVTSAEGAEVLGERRGGSMDVLPRVRACISQQVNKGRLRVARREGTTAYYEIAPLPKPISDEPAAKQPLSLVRSGS